MDITLHNEKKHRVLKIVLIIMSLMPIIDDIMRFFQYYFDEEMREYFNYALTPLNAIPVILSIFAIIFYNKPLFISSFLTFNLLSIYTVNICGFRSVGTFIELGFDTFWFSQIIFSNNNIVKIISLVLLIALFITSIIATIGFFKKCSKKIKLVSIIPYFVVALLFVISFVFEDAVGYDIIDMFRSILSTVLTTILPLIMYFISFFFYFNYTRKSNKNKYTPEVLLSRLNDSYIFGDISRQEYETEREKIINSI